MLIGTQRWFGGQMIDGEAVAAEHTGATFSTVTAKDADVELPATSALEQFTVVVPITNALPLAALQTTGRLPATMSDDEVVYETATPVVVVAGTVMFAGTVSTGGVVSCTVTVNDLPVELPALSVAVQATTCVPRPNVVPDDGAQLVTTVPSTASVAETWNSARPPAGSVASIVRSFGSWSIGGVVSTISTTT
jgi:hypothetical protein